MSHSKVRVIVRARPTPNGGNVYKFNEESDSIDILPPAHGDVKPEPQHYQVDKLICNATQESVFHTATDDLVQSLMDGYNSTIMAYGQTGAGKTFTIAGSPGGAFAQRGIIARVVSRVFSEIASRPESLISVRLSYMEIYNELCFDLLSRVAVKDQKGDLIFMEDGKGNIICRQLSLAPAGSEEQALNIFFTGDAQKALAEHTLNDASSRSHTLFTIYVDSRSRVE